MRPPPEKPTIVDRVNSIDFDAKPKHNTLRNKMRLWQKKSQQAETSTGQVGQPKRRKPSMPPLPWDNSK